MFFSQENRPGSGNQLVCTHCHFLEHTWMSCILFLPLRLEQQVRHKEAVEKKLFSRFVPVMNEKKAKIRGLQEDLYQLQQTEEKQRDKAERQRSAWDGFL